MPPEWQPYKFQEIWVWFSEMTSVFIEINSPANMPGTSWNLRGTAELATGGKGEQHEERTICNFESP